MIQDFVDAANRFKMSLALTADEIYGKFREFLKGNARDSWDNVVSSRVARTYNTFEQDIKILTEEILVEKC